MMSNKKEKPMIFNIDNETKTQLLIERIASLNLEGYQHELNLKSAQAVGNTEAVAQAEASIEIIQQAILIHEAELD